MPRAKSKNNAQSDPPPTEPAEAEVSITSPAPTNQETPAILEAPVPLATIENTRKSVPASRSTKPKAAAQFTFTQKMPVHPVLPTSPATSTSTQVTASQVPAAPEKEPAATATKKGGGKKRKAPEQPDAVRGSPLMLPLSQLLILS